MQPQSSWVQILYLALSWLLWNRASGNLHVIILIGWSNMLPIPFKQVSSQLLGLSQFYFVKIGKGNLSYSVLIRLKYGFLRDELNRASYTQL
jgi:hypothetical protein